MSNAGKWLWNALEDWPGVEVIDASELRPGDHLIGLREAVAAKETTYLQKLGVEQDGRPKNADDIAARTVRKAPKVKRVAHDWREQPDDVLGAQCRLAGDDDVIVVPYGDPILIVRG